MLPDHVRALRTAFILTTIAAFPSLLALIGALQQGRTGDAIALGIVTTALVLASFRTARAYDVWRRRRATPAPIGGFR